MSRLLIVPPLRLDESVPFAADPSDQVLELLARRPNAVVSTLAALIVERGIDRVALLEPVAGTQDGGYGAACLQALAADLTARHIELIHLAPGQDAFGTLRANADGSIAIGETGEVGAAQPHRLDAGHALLVDDEAGADDSVIGGSALEQLAFEQLAFEQLVRVTVDVVVGAAIRADDILRAMHDAARRVVAQHPGRYVIAEAELLVDAAGRRLLQWPGVAEHALADARAMAAHDALALWWGALRVTRHEVPAPLFDGGPDCRDALAADLLGVCGPAPASAAAASATSGPSQRSDTSSPTTGSDGEDEDDGDRDGVDSGDDRGREADGDPGSGLPAFEAATATGVRSGHLLLPPPPAPPAFAPPPMRATRRAPVVAPLGDTDGGDATDNADDIDCPEDFDEPGDAEDVDDLADVDDLDELHDLADPDDLDDLDELHDPDAAGHGVEPSAGPVRP